MKNLPKGMIPDRDNQVYYDTERNQFYMITWKDEGNREVPTRHYIQLDIKFDNTQGQMKKHLKQLFCRHNWKTEEIPFKKGVGHGYGLVTEYYNTKCIKCNKKSVLTHEY